MFFLLIQRHWLIIHVNFSPLHSSKINLDRHTSSLKPIKIFYWKHEKWHQEEISIIWDKQNTLLNLKQIINQWLKVHHDELLISPHLSVESIILSSPESEAYLSFNQSLFRPEWSIMQKWQILESLFKTIHRAHFHIASVSLLVHHQPMDDDHLDLSQPLTIQERL